MRIPLVSLLVVAVAGCSSKGGNGGDGGVTPGCHAEIAADGEVRWDDDGVHQCADIVVADRSIDGPGLIITVSIVPPPPLGGTYTCDGDAGARDIFRYTTSTNMTAPPTGCTVTFTNAGAPGVHATGTFSATVSPPAGGSKSISNGFFDVPLLFLGD